MDIPHIEEIRAHRRTIAEAEGAASLVQQIQAVLSELTVAKAQPLVTLPGDALLEALCSREDLRHLRDLGPDASTWMERVETRERALRSAEAVLSPLAIAAHHAAHEIHDLRQLQLEALAAPDHADTLARVHAMFERHAQLKSAIETLSLRARSIQPVPKIIEVLTDVIDNALASERPNRDAVCTAIAASARTTLVSHVEALGHSLTPATATTGVEDVRGVRRELVTLSAVHARIEREIAAEIEQQTASLTLCTHEIEDLLG